jgi:hypothetical protein
MKKLILLPVIGFVLFSACKDDEGSHMAYIEKIQDSVFKAYPTMPHVGVKVSTDGEQLTLIIGDKGIYNATEEKQMQVANNVTQISLAIFGKENHLSKSSVIISKDEKSEEPSPEDSKTIAVNIDSLKKAG